MIINNIVAISWIDRVNYIPYLVFSCTRKEKTKSLHQSCS